MRDIKTDAEMKYVKTARRDDERYKDRLEDGRY